jgi:signal transduction histidine kinase
VWVGIPIEVAFAGVRRSLARNLGALGVVGLLAVVAAWVGTNRLIRRPLAAVLTATNRLRAGERGARAGLVHSVPEFTQLGRAFDAMAEATERHLNERLQAEQAWRRSARGLQVLSECNQIVARVDQETEMLQAVCRLLVEDGGYRLAWVGAAEKDGERTIRPVAQWGYEEGYLGTLQLTWADVERGRGPAGRAIRTGQPVVTRHIDTDPTFALWREEAISRGYGSSLALPLTVEGAALGVLNIYAVHPDGFDSDEVKLLTGLADDLAFGVGALRARQAREKAEVVRRSLYQACVALQSPGPLDRRLQELLKRAHELLDLDRLLVFLVDPEGGTLRAVASVGAPPSVDGLEVAIGPEADGLTRAYRDQTVVVWNSDHAIPEEQRLTVPGEQTRMLRSRNCAVVPLVVQGRTIGVMVADRGRRRDSFDPATIELLQLFAGHAAPAVEQARLYEELRSAADHLQAMVEDRTRALQAANAKLQAAVQQLQAASRHKSEFLATMSHELRTPLNSIIGFADLLLTQSGGSLSEKQERFLSHIRSSGKHLLGLIGDILDLAKIEAGKIALHPEEIVIAEIVEDILVIVRGLANKKSQIIESHVAEQLSLLYADPVRFKQILFNLLSNAVKFTPPGGRIVLEARRAADPHGCLEIRVRDTGVGIRAEDLPRLFHEFVQLETTEAQRHEGTGLGLALTRRLVELHGGRIWAESEGEGRGATFAVVLPFGHLR